LASTPLSAGKSSVACVIDATGERQQGNRGRGDCGRVERQRCHGERGIGPGNRRCRRATRKPGGPAGHRRL